MGMINLNQDAGGIFLGNNRTNTFFFTRNPVILQLDDTSDTWHSFVNYILLIELQATAVFTLFRSLC